MHSPMDLNDRVLYMNHLNKFEEAEKEFRLALEIKPNYVSAHCNLALLLSIRFGKVPTSS